MSVGLQHDGEYNFIDQYVKSGRYLIHNRVSTYKEDIIYSNALYEGYNTVDKTEVVMSKDDAISAARAILKHFNCGMED